MSKYRAKEVRYNDGTYTITFQVKILWWWVDMEIACGDSFQKATSNICSFVVEYDKFKTFELSNIEYSQVQDILQWLSSGDEHVCLYDKRLGKIFYGIPVENKDWTYISSMDVHEMLQYVQDLKKTELDKTHVIKWKLGKHGLEKY